MKIEMTKCDHCGKLTAEAPLLIGKHFDHMAFSVGEVDPNLHSQVWEACGPACRLKLIAKLLDGENTEHVA